MPNCSKGGGPSTAATSLRSHSWPQMLRPDVSDRSGRYRGSLNIDARGRVGQRKAHPAAEGRRQEVVGATRIHDEQRGDAPHLGRDEWAVDRIAISLVRQRDGNARHGRRR